MAWSRSSAASRGYGHEWRQLRKAVLERDVWRCQCEVCQAPSTRVARVATEVDHIKAKADGGTDDLDNLRSVNGECHRRITLAAQGRTYRPRPRIGLDGRPIGEDGW